MNPEHDELDRLIDRALSGYSAAEPLAGLEQRVLYRIRSRPRQVWRFWPAVAVPALATLLMVWLYPEPRVEPPAPVAAVLKSPPLTPVASRPEPSVRVARRSVLPKQERFPLPTPLTNEERALIAWATRAPDEARKAFEDLRKRAEEPLEIKPIEIRPLDNDGAR